MLKEIIGHCIQYFEDDAGLRQGVCVETYENGGGTRAIYQYLNNVYHGQYMAFYENGWVYYNVYFVNGDIIHDFVNHPLSDEERVILSLKYGAPMVPADLIPEVSGTFSSVGLLCVRKVWDFFLYRFFR